MNVRVSHPIPFFVWARLQRMAIHAAFATLGVVLAIVMPAFPQSQTVGEFWPTVDAHVQLPHDWRILGFTGLKKGEDYPYQQVYLGGGLGYQWKRITKAHRANLNPDVEHHFVFAGGYERLQSISSGKTKDENRLGLQALASYRLGSRFLISDRNRVEFRWVDGSYSTRYRNKLLGLYDLNLHHFHFSPYASAEAFYDGAVSSWNEEQYTAGIEWPYKHRLLLQTYYLRQNCTTCNPQYLNVGGLTLSLFF